ncbi:hypothetical protein LWI28_017667 [Acer negundo]|uniref:DNA-binding protein BIN4 n=1 Tax=Acer negundo TaxID=4023 RepID=A0AAD5NGY5_ACENE|nr:hypothetical protein LWI28_017667 [Acer negundo]KAK4834839.1 hypothetical protein QYF36_001256 [Acer negundo]
MSGSREASPDWLRSFQAPTHSTMTLSSDSDSSHNGSRSIEEKIDCEEPSVSDSSQLPLPDKGIVIGERGTESPSNKVSKAKSLKDQLQVDHTLPKKKKRQGDGDDGKVTKNVISEKHVEAHAPKTSFWELSSDTEEEFSLQKKEEDEDSALIGREGKSPTKKSLKGKSPKKEQKITGHSPKKEKDVNNNMKRKGNDGNETVEEDAAEKRTEPNVSTSTLPLVLSEKVQRTKALVECEGESIDLSGDMGAVGRTVIQDTANGSHEMYLDLKGTIYKTTIVPSRTFCVVSFGQSEAKIEAIMNDFIQLKPMSNVYEAETMVEGTLDGFSFDSEDEADKIPKATSHQTDQNDGVEVQGNGKTKTKAAKPSGTARKRGASAGGKSQPPKKARKKTVVSKKARGKK